MTITGDLSTRDFKDVERKGGPRVVTCYSDGDPTIKHMAKIFDALDHPLMGDPNCDLRPRETCVECMDCTARADLDYAMEAAVYEGFLRLGTRNSGTSSRRTMAVGRLPCRRIRLASLGG